MKKGMEAIPYARLPSVSLLDLYPIRMSDFTKDK